MLLLERAAEYGGLAPNAQRLSDERRGLLPSLLRSTEPQARQIRELLAAGNGRGR